MKISWCWRTGGVNCRTVGWRNHRAARPLRCGDNITATQFFHKVFPIFFKTRPPEQESSYPFHRLFVLGLGVDTALVSGDRQEQLRVPGVFETFAPRFLMDVLHHVSSWTPHGRRENPQPSVFPDYSTVVGRIPRVKSQGSRVMNSTEDIVCVREHVCV